MTGTRGDAVVTMEQAGMTAAPPGGGQKVTFNPFSAAFRRDPYETYRRLRENAPTYRIMGSWLLSRYPDIIRVLRDRRFSSSRIPDLVKRGGRGLNPSESYHDYKGIEGFIAKAIVFTENPDHSRLRRLTNNIFDPDAVLAERPRIARIARDLVAGSAADGGMELIEDYADKIPMYLMCERLGVPWEVGPSLRDWAHEARMLLDPTLMSRDDYVRVEGVMQEALSYLQGVIEERKRKPGHDVISILLSNRDKEDRLSDEEVALLCIMTFVAGHETTKHLIGNGVLALLQHPDQAAKLRVDPSLADNAIEEVLRYDPPLQQTKRVAIADVEFNDVTIREGNQVLLLLGSANHDPEIFPEPERFLIDRENASANIGFGYGMRACLGGKMAHLEAAVACETLFCGDYRIELAEDHLEWQDQAVILRGLRRLPVRVAHDGAV